MAKSVNLSDRFMINQALEMHELEIEPIYWKTEDALSRGDTNLASGLFILILYAAKYNKKLLQALQPGYRRRLKEISYELFGDYVPKNHKAITIRGALAESNLPFKMESEMRDHLADHPEILSRAFGEEVKIVGTEVPCEYDDSNEYRCDVVAKNNKNFYPIELKIRQATHSVVSQCSKYCWYFYRQLRYGAYRDIQGIVIANGLDAWSINELRRENIRCFTVHAPDGDIELREIKPK